MTADWPDYNDSQHKANAIAATGVPLLSGALNLLKTGNVIVPAGGTSTQGPFADFPIGYEIFVSIGCNVASSFPFMTVQMTWSDSASGRTVAVEQWDLCGVSGGAFQQYVGTGPTKGDTLNILVSNQDNVNSMTYVMAFTQNSRVYSRDDWRQITSHTPPGFTNANMSGGALMLASTGASIAANGTNVRLISLYAGEAFLSISNGAQGLVFTITEIADPTIGLGSQGGLVYSNQVAANGDLNAIIHLPRSVCAMALQNLSTTTAMSPIASINAGSILT